MAQQASVTSSTMAMLAKHDAEISSLASSVNQLTDTVNKGFEKLFEGQGRAGKVNWQMASFLVGVVVAAVGFFYTPLRLVDEGLAANIAKTELVIKDLDLQKRLTRLEVLEELHDRSDHERVSHGSGTGKQ